MASGDMNNHLEETVLLIQLVRDRPALYDRTRSDFKDPAYKQSIWQEVGDLMGCTSQEIHKRWISLRDRYTAEHRKLKKNPNSGQSTWHFSESMSFLEKQIIERKRILPIYSTIRNGDTVEEPSEVKIESFDSGVSGDSQWEGVVVDSATNDYEDQAIAPDIETSTSSGKRRRSLSPDSLREKIKLEGGIIDSLREIGTAARKLADAKTDVESADVLFGKMIGVMISELNEDDKGRAKIHIMSYLCTHGYRSSASD